MRRPPPWGPLLRLLFAACLVTLALGEEKKTSGYLGMMEVQHIDLQCNFHRLSYDGEKHYLVGNSSSPSKIAVDSTVSHCNLVEGVVITTENGNILYYVSVLDGAIKIAVYAIDFKSITKGVRDGTGTQMALPPGVKIDLKTCFSATAYIYCLRKRKRKSGRLRHGLARFAVANTQTVYYGTIDIVVAHAQEIDQILFDPDRAEIAITYKPFNGHESNSLDIRSLHKLHMRGLLVYPTGFDPRSVVGITSHNGFRFFNVYNKDAEGADKYKTYRTTLYSPRVSKAVATEFPNATELGEGRPYMFAKYLRDTMNDSEVAQASMRRCASAHKLVVECLDAKKGLEGTRVVMFVVVGFLMFLFILLAVLLALYLICCVKTKRRRRRKKKHRKHRKHRKAVKNDTSGTPAKNDEADVEVDPSKMDKKEDDEEEKEKKEDNKVVQKLKAFGGVDYSSSSSEDNVEHSQKYFSAREQFDENGNPKDGEGSQAQGDDGNNKYENLGPGNDNTTQSGIPDDDFVKQTGEKNNGPKSVYMKAKKKKK